MEIFFEEDTTDSAVLKEDIINKASDSIIKDSLENTETVKQRVEKFNPKLIPPKNVSQETKK